MIHEVGIFFQGQASIANAQSIGINKHIYLHTCRYQICCKIHDLYSDLLYRMVNAYDSVDVPLHDLIVFTSPLLQIALGGTASISEEDLSIFWEPWMILFTHTVTAP